MKKKVIKKKVVTKPTPSEDVELLPMARVNDPEDVGEDHKVFDMSNIAAPVIEFELPNLTERPIPEKTSDDSDDVDESEEPKEKKKQETKKKKTAAPSTTKKVPLTAEKLNNELVGLRATIVTSKNQLMSKLVRQKKKLSSKKKLTPEDERKIARLTEEIVGLKAFDKDTVAKFAALNTKSLADLKIEGATPVAERLMYKLATQEIVEDKVEKMREKYVEWSKTAAFFMQRLGLQYSNKEKKEKDSGKSEKPTEPDDVDDGSEASEDVEDGSEDSEDVVEESEEPKESEDVEQNGSDADDFNESDVEMVDSDEEAGEEAAKKRRDVLLGLIGVKEDKSRPSLKPKKRKIVEDCSEDVTPTVKKGKETTMKAEMKAAFEKELKTKEKKKPQKAKAVKKTVAPKKNTEKEKEEEVDADLPEDVGLETLVMKVDLSKGGKIAKTQKTQKTSEKKAEDVVALKDDNNDEDDDESASFFLPKTSGSQRPKRAAAAPKTSAPKLPVKKVEKPAPKKTVKAVAPVEKKKGSSKNNGVAEGEVHPSWAASQLKKKAMEAAKPCGKKITFGDDDD